MFPTVGKPVDRVPMEHLHRFTLSMHVTTEFQSSGPEIFSYRAREKVEMVGESLVASYSTGFGFSDVENQVTTHPLTSMRIASISKALTAAAVARLVEQGDLDLDKPVDEYVEAWPKDQPTITARQLVTHMAGIRHYRKKDELEDNGEEKDGELKEFHLRKRFDSVSKALDIFKRDELLSAPGMISVVSSPLLLPPKELMEDQTFKIYILLALEGADASDMRPASLIKFL